MADAVTLDSWTGHDVGLDQVIDILAEMRRSTAQAASRTSVLTLVVDAMTDDEAYRAMEAMRALGAHHPARLISLRPDREADRVGVDARVTVWASWVGDRRVTAGEIRLDVKGAAADHLDSIIEPLTLPDLPVVVWYPGGLPSVGEPLVECADAVVIDSKEAGGAQAFAVVTELANQQTVVDLSWARLRPWRELLAALFDGPAYRPFATGVTSIEVDGKPAPRHLLAGWLASRLGTPRAAVHLRDAQHVSVQLHADYRGQRGLFSVSRRPGERMVRATVTIEDGPGHSQLLPLPDDSLAWSLGRALTHLSRDPIWEDALSEAVALWGA